MNNKLSNELSIILDLPPPEIQQIVTYLESLDSTEEIENYLEGLIGHDKKFKQVVKDFISLTKKKKKEKTTTTTTSRIVEEVVKEEKIANLNKEQKKKEKKKKVKNFKDVDTELDDLKAVGIIRYDTDGRIICDCQASKHNLLTNCLNCGRIICQLEGVGGQPATNRKNDFIQFPELQQSEEVTESLIKAQKNAEKLLDFDKNSVARTKVHDSASDFDYKSQIGDKWLTFEERALALKKSKELERLEEENKRRRVISIDLKSKTISDVTPKKIVLPNELETNNQQKEEKKTSPNFFSNPSILNKPVYIESSITLDSNKIKKNLKSKINVKSQRDIYLDDTVSDKLEISHLKIKPRLNRLQNDLFLEFVGGC
ncbi:hypothetical protein HDU92_002621 [Lobulomyces angularis]|nr:hypothetical protein HDU92_002621 [Lobulomyces angularis]